MPKDDETDPKQYPNVRQGKPLTADDVPERISATNLLIGALEDFSNFEPDSAIVIYRGECGCVVVRSNIPPLESIGLMEVSKASMIGSVLSHEDVDFEEPEEEGKNGVN